MTEQNTTNFTSTEYWRIIKEMGSFNDKWAESVATKAEIFNKLIKSLNPNAETILFAKFSPIALHLAKFYSVTVVCDFFNLLEDYDFSHVNVVNNIESVQQKFDVVMAIDEARTVRDELSKLLLDLHAAQEASNKDVQVEFVGGTW